GDRQGMHKNGRKKAQKTQKGQKELRSQRKNVFLDLQLCGAEVDEEAVFDPAGAQVAEQLRHVVVVQGFARLQLHDQATLHEQVGEILAEHGAVLIVDQQLVLRLDVQPSLAQAVSQPVLVHLLKVPVPQIPVQREARLTDQVAQRKHVAGRHDSLPLILG